MLIQSGLEKKVVLITGGGRGIGAECVRLFAEQGAEVHFFYRENVGAAESLCQSCEEKNHLVFAYRIDVCDKHQVTNAIEEIAARTGTIDVLVNNSGIVRDGLMMGLTADDITAVMNTNVMGVFNTIQAVLPFMTRARHGKIINLSSVAGDKGGRGQANYAASKGAINALTKALAAEVAKRNITVNAVAPGVIETAMSKEVRELGGDETLAKIALNRYGRPEEVAYVILFLASRYADYMTGEIIHVDGGFKIT